MNDSGSPQDRFALPSNWKVLGAGTNKFQKELKNDYFVVETPSDVITVLIYNREIDMRHISELSSWSFVRRVKINEHEGFIHNHPNGFRKMLTWYCPDAGQTFLIHFSKAQDEVVQTFRVTKCHQPDRSAESSN